MERPEWTGAERATLLLEAVLCWGDSLDELYEMFPGETYSAISDLGDDVLEVTSVAEGDDERFQWSMATLEAVNREALHPLFEGEPSWREQPGRDAWRALVGAAARQVLVSVEDQVLLSMADALVEQAAEALEGDSPLGPEEADALLTSWHAEMNGWEATRAD